MKVDIKSMLPPELAEYFESIGAPAFRERQVFRWLHSGVKEFAEMTDLPVSLRSKLDNEFFISVPLMLEKQVSATDGTTKYLWGMADGAAVESVIMDYEHGLSVCVSTQVGCRMGCVFCASTIGGLSRNLAASEMIDQVLFSQLDAGRRISTVVLMGIGEPLDNMENVVRFIKLISHPGGMNIGARHLTLSTCGIIENIDKLAELDIKSTLAVSLHAPDNETRSLLMPINASTGVDELLRACGRYFRATGRRVTFEYALIKGVNDADRHAELLSRRLIDSGGHLNLILLNDVPERGFSPSSPERMKAFTRILEQNGVNFTLRRRLGRDIDAACGQLRRRGAD